MAGPGLDLDRVVEVVRRSMPLFNEDWWLRNRGMLGDWRLVCEKQVEYPYTRIALVSGELEMSDGLGLAVEGWDCWLAPPKDVTSRYLAEVKSQIPEEQWESFVRSVRLLRQWWQECETGCGGDLQEMVKIIPKPQGKEHYDKAVDKIRRESATCPTCGALAMERCRTTNGKEVGFHAARKGDPTGEIHLYVGPVRPYDL
jgi:ribosomal protein S27AE